MSITRTEDMTIDTFPVTEENQADYNICKELLKHPETFRLVFFHLPANERLHLKHSLMNFWSEEVDWVCATASEFTTDLIAAIMSGNRPCDLAKYLDPAILLLDDAQHLAGKDTTQEQLYVILKRRLEQKKLTIIFSEVGIDRLRVAMREELVHLLAMGVPEDNCCKGLSLEDLDFLRHGPGKLEA